MNRNIGPHDASETSFSEGSLGCVIIHHRNMEKLPTTINLIRSQGIAADSIVVVDNSEGHVPDRAFETLTQSGINLRRIQNRGYGNAANHGIETLLAKKDTPDYILIATHEVEPREGAIENLLAGLENEPHLMMVGPMLISELPGGGVRRSFGGIRTVLGVPMHVESCDQTRHPSSQPTPEILDRAWLDGAFIVYRSSFLREQRFREEFFLYFEETELHFRLKAHPGSVGCIPAAVVNEVESGIPPYLRTRNLQWFIQLHGRYWQRIVTVPWVLTKIFAKVVLGKMHFAAFRLGVAGWITACRHPLRR